MSIQPGSEERAAGPNNLVRQGREAMDYAEEIRAIANLAENGEEDPMVLGLRRKLLMIIEELQELLECGTKAMTDDAMVPIFRAMMKTGPGLYERFRALFEELCDSNGLNDLQAQDRELRSQAKSIYFQACALEDTFGSNRLSCGPSNSTTMQQHISTARPPSKLPKITLPPFDGQRARWQRFRDTFESLVINDPYLTPIDRFHYLEASLQGPAAAVIARLPLTEVNFPIAWKALLRTYDNPRLLATSYLDQLLAMKSLNSKPNAEQLKHIICQLSECVAAFQQIPIADKSDFLLFYLAHRVLDAQTREAFELQNDCTKFPKFDDLIDFLSQRCTAIELAMGSSTPTGAVVTKATFSKPLPRFSSTFSRCKNSLMVSHSAERSNTSSRVGSNMHLRADAAQGSSTLANATSPCPACHGAHNLVKCSRFSNMSMDERHSCLTNWSGCRNCLFSSHSTRKCVSRGRCRFCQARHHSLLHIESHNSTPTTSRTQADTSHLASSTQDKKKGPPVTRTLSAINPRELKILLGTALCSILDPQGRPHTIRLVLDSGSQFSFLSRSVAVRLGLDVKSCNIAIMGIGQTPCPGFKGKTVCRLVSHAEPVEVSTQALVVDTITSDLPSLLLSEAARSPYLPYQLADPSFWDPRPIDFLLGSDLFADILTGDIVTLAEGQPKLIGTIFGFVVIGRVADISEAQYTHALCATAPRHPDIDPFLAQDLQYLWELEDSPSSNAVNPEDIECEAFFAKSHYRLPTGRYVVRLPFKGASPQFPSTRWSAIKRLSHVESKLARNPEIRQLYEAFMAEYEDLGHMVPATGLGQYLIPHHGVTKGSKNDLKIRVVFDASASTSMGSLNDHLHIGPKLQRRIVEILLQFRRHKICFAVDLVKMYRQIMIHPEDRTYQHILWRSDPSLPVKEYELCTVSYGQSCAPYLALRTVQQLIEDEGAAYPLAAEAIRHYMYVDDLATGADSLEQALDLQRQVIALMAKGEFPLSKWASNHPKLLETVSSQETQHSTMPRKLENPEDRTRLKILGLQWDPLADCFSYDVVAPEPVFTKRALLAAVSRIYDPLGFLGPTVIQAKMLIQSAWKLGADWDTVLPEPLQDKWASFVSQLVRLSSIKIPRWICPASATSYDILIFGDASELAYCAAAYLRTCQGSDVQINLVLSKTKLAPIKLLSIPRLELCAALLASSLLKHLSSFIEKLPKPPNIHLFSDSTVALGWLNTPPFQLQTFVANRVTQILSVTDTAQWFHVRSQDNPSDLGSRGVDADKLADNSLWFNGPEWAIMDRAYWPIKSFVNHDLDVTTLPERKRTPCLAATTEESYLHQYISHTSSYISLIRIFAWLRRFHNNCNSSLSTCPPCVGPLTFLETKKSLLTIIKVVQSHNFFLGRPPSSSLIPKALLSLQPFLDEDGILRVGGRLKQSNLPFSTRHPILLPGKSHLSSLIITHYHRLHLHPGPSLLLSIIRRKFWIIGARGQIRHFTRQCILCRRLNATPCQPIMADLPSERFSEGRAFLHTGIDFAGPFLIRESLRRKAALGKCYLCLFICLTSRAVHLEAVSAASTPAFQAALNRFISRRGLPRLILSDNGTNFVGASNQLRDLYAWYRQNDTELALKDYATLHELEWRFIPPHAPHFGGSWEAGIRSAKRLLRSVYGDGVFTFEELSTLFTRIEAIMNSRPICPLSSDPEDLDALTPGHLLIGGPLIAPIEVDFIDIKEGRLTRWQHVQQRTQCFWKRWKAECLHELQVRSKWRNHQRNVQPHDLVLIVGEECERKKWPLGRVTEVFPGKDGVVRVASVQTVRGIFRRPVTKLILLLPSNLLGEEVQPTSPGS